MILRNLYLILLVIYGSTAMAQTVPDVTVLSIPENLKENANAVVRLDRTDIVIASRKSMVVKSHRIVTVFNEKGMGVSSLSASYDKVSRIRSIEAIVYNASGQEIKKIRKKDFSDQSLSEGFDITDGRILYNGYEPQYYPCTIEFKVETETSNTAYIEPWYPVYATYTGVELSEFSITYAKELGFKYKEFNFAGQTFSKVDDAGKITYKAQNIVPLKSEEYMPAHYEILPHVLFGVNKFNIEGLDGEATDWGVFGAWFYNNLINGTDELPAATVDKIKALTAGETDPLKKAKIVYEYVQGKTRYISIQLGIGGWKPMLAKDVDRLGYGDCKALSNYTRALLKAIGIQSYYALVYGDNDKRDLLKDFVSPQGNHVILAIPSGNSYVWLECTSQAIPFGFQGKFTDDRMALLLKPDKGELVRTNIYDSKSNTQVLSGNYAISEAGAISGSLKIASKGIQYNNKYFLDGLSADNVTKFYKSGFSNINNLKLKKTGLKNNKENQEFIEDIAIEAEGYCIKSGNRVIFAVNAFNKSSHIPQRYRARKNPVAIERGYVDTDEVAIDLPQGYTIEAKPQNIILTDKFGEYKAEYVMDGTHRLLYKRSFVLNQGNYDSKEYENYRQFREKIASHDNAKIVLVKN